MDQTVYSLKNKIRWFWITCISGLLLITVITLRLWASSVESSIVAYDSAHGITKIVFPKEVVVIMSQNFWLLLPVFAVIFVVGGLRYIAKF